MAGLGSKKSNIAGAGAEVRRRTPERKGLFEHDRPRGRSGPDRCPRDRAIDGAWPFDQSPLTGPTSSFPATWRSGTRSNGNTHSTTCGPTRSWSSSRTGGDRIEAGSSATYSRRDTGDRSEGQIGVIGAGGSDRQLVESPSRDHT